MSRSKNSCRITVGGVAYLWRAKGDDGCITLAIRPANNLGGRIRCSFPYCETWIPQGEGRWRSAGDQIVITNRIVRRVIEFAVLERSYDPLERAHELNLHDVVFDISDAVRANDPQT